MANYVNGSRLRVYHEPPTNEMLEMMHAGKNRKVVHKKMKQEAQTKAQEQAQKHYTKRLYFNNAKASIVATCQMPLLQIAMEFASNYHITIFDLEVEAHILPLSIYNCLYNKTK